MSILPFDSLFQKAGFNPNQKRDPLGKWAVSSGGKKKERVEQGKGLENVATRQNKGVVVSSPWGDSRPFQKWAEDSYVPTPDTIKVSNDNSICRQAWPEKGQNVCCESEGVVHLSPAAKQETFLHEVGHSYDRNSFTDSDRDEVRKILGIPAGNTWFQSSASSDAPADIFASAYSTAARRKKLLPNETYYVGAGGYRLKGKKVIQLRNWLLKRSKPPGATISRRRRRNVPRIIQ